MSQKRVDAAVPGPAKHRETNRENQEKHLVVENVSNCLITIINCRVCLAKTASKRPRQDV